jgi:hypothetical protein
VQVLRGRVIIAAGTDTADGSAGQLLTLSDARHTVQALEDAVLLLTGAERATPMPADPGSMPPAVAGLAARRPPMSAPRTHC